MSPFLVSFILEIINFASESDRTIEPIPGSTIMSAALIRMIQTVWNSDTNLGIKEKNSGFERIQVGLLLKTNF